MFDIRTLSRRDQRLFKVCQHVVADLTKRPTLAELADLASVERTYFCKVFSQAVGIRFSAWNRLVRVEQAKVLLRESALDVTAIANAVGYADVTTFARNFRKAEGLAPLRYRRLHRGPTLQASVARIAEKTTINAETPAP